MEPQPYDAPPTVADRMLGLLLMTGFMMVITAVPLGAALAYKDYQLHDDWEWALILGALVAIVVAVVGSLFVWTTTLVVKQRWRMQTKR